MTDTQILILSMQIASMVFNFITLVYIMIADKSIKAMNYDIGRMVYLLDKRL